MAEHERTEGDEEAIGDASADTVKTPDAGDEGAHPPSGPPAPEEAPAESEAESDTLKAPRGDEG